MAIITISILAAAYAFLETHQGDIASKMIASAGYDILKNSLDFGSLKNKIKGFFKKDEQQDEFIKQLCDEKISLEDQPETSIKNSYENITGETYNEDIFLALKEWLSENKEKIQQMNNVTISNSSGFNIGVQNAQGNIFNVQGNYNINPNKDGH